mmetsp:Transcript_139615/g.197701  ORF Transcript_139615/g.197701 Transcript_139615/m.197701 type:complete len:231 (+) Transcript_139615:50-742(+)
MKFALVFVMCLAATQAFHLGHLFHNIGHAIHHVGDDIHNDVKKIGSNIHNDVDKLKDAVNKVHEHVETLVKHGEKIAENVVSDIEKGAEDIVAEAEKIAKDLDLGLPCIEAILKNKAIFKIFESKVTDLEKVDYWNDIADELYNICVGCTNDPSKFAWIKTAKLAIDDAAECISDVTTVIKDGAMFLSGSGLLDIPMIKGFINSIVDIGKACPAAVKAIEQLVKDAQNKH